MKNRFLTIAALALAAVSCNTKTAEPLQYGELSVRLSAEPTVEVVSKADAPDTDGFMVYIYESDEGNYNPAEDLVYNQVFSAFEPQRLKLGEYTVTAENITPAAAESGTGSMRLFGSTQVTLSTSSLSAQATIDCFVANALVSVRFDDSVTGLFEGLQVTLTGGTTRTQDIVIPETHSGTDPQYWFNPSDLTYKISGTFTGGGMNKPVEIEKTIALEAQNNIVLNVKVNLSGELIVGTITVNTDMNDQTIEEGYNPYITE